MKTTTMRTVGVIFSAGILLTSCVSSKKYHRSQDEVAKLRADSTTLAQQASTLQQNLTATEQKNTDLQKSLENANTTNTGLQKNVAYYHDYFDKQQATATQTKDELNTSLAPAGITSEDIMMVDGKIFVNIGEKSLFKGRTAVLSSKGKDLVNNLGEFVKSHEGLDVSVADLEQANGTNDNAMASSGTMATNTDQNSQSSGVSDNSNATKSNNDNMSTGTKTYKHVAVHHRKRTHPVAGESKAVAYSSGHHNKYSSERRSRSVARAMAWKRQNVVADALLKNGIPKVKLVSQLPGETTTGQKGVQVVLVHNMDDYYKHMNEAPAAGQPVSKNP